MKLHIKRTSIAHSRCNFPDCSNWNSLSRIRNDLRYFISTDQKVFIPKNVVVCPLHNQIEAWRNVYNLIPDTEMVYTKKCIEEMFKLLSETKYFKSAAIVDRKSLCKMNKSFENK